MQCVLNQSVIVALLFTCLMAWTSAEGLSCNSCGEECTDACGTRFFRTCCFNYLRKRSAPVVGPAQSNDLKENIWFDKAQIEKIIHNEFLRQHNLNTLDQNQKASQRNDDFQKPIPASSGNQIGLANNHEQMHGIYDI